VPRHAQRLEHARVLRRDQASAPLLQHVEDIHLEVIPEVVQDLQRRPIREQPGKVSSRKSS
jgi:hypothetical protein